ncbi:uncharacterized protein LOC106013392, partial [Aplysia californica]|uniref:Uncharacterized protein LOC106013392 n=1 Tax=Aplysia californica TaxID=6500 RepID=A0ABM1W201_APLCA
MPCNDTLRIVASTGGTMVRVFSDAGHVDVYLDSPGAMIDIMVGGKLSSSLLPSSPCPVVIVYVTTRWIQAQMTGTSAMVRSNNPVLVVQILLDFFKTLSTGISVLTPVSQYVNFARLNLPIWSGFSDYIMVTSLDATNNDNLQLGSTPVSMTFEPLTNVTFFVSNALTQSFIQLDSGVLGFTFGGHAYSASADKATFTTLPSGSELIFEECVLTKGTSGDGIDNDCDGDVDEEPCTDTLFKDIDGDGMYDEDCDEPPEPSAALESSPVLLTSSVLEASFVLVPSSITEFYSVGGSSFVTLESAANTLSIT